MRIAFHRNLAGHHGGLPRFFQVLSGAFELADVEVVSLDDQPDVVYAPSLTFEEYPETELPVVGTFHDAHWHHFSTFGRESSAVLEVLAQKWMSRATLICCSSQAIRRELSTFYPDHAEKIRVIHLPPLLTETNDRGAAAAALVRERGLPSRFAYMPAQAGPHKNHMRLFTAWSILHARGRIEPLPLVLSGMLTDHVAGPNGPLPLLGLEPGRDVVGLGYVPDEAVRVLFEQADVLVMPTLYDAGSFPIMEAMAAGVPVVSSNLPSVLEQVRRQGVWCTFFDRHRPADIARAMEDALLDPGRTMALATHARMAVASRGWEWTGAGYRAVFEEARERHRRGRVAATPALRATILADPGYPGASRWATTAKQIALGAAERLGIRLELTVPAVPGPFLPHQDLIFAYEGFPETGSFVIGGPGDTEANLTLGYSADCDIVVDRPFDPRGASAKDCLWTRSRYALPEAFTLAVLGTADASEKEYRALARELGEQTSIGAVVGCGSGTELLPSASGIVGLGLIDDRELRALYWMCAAVVVPRSGRLRLTAAEGAASGRAVWGWDGAELHSLGHDRTFQPTADPIGNVVAHLRAGKVAA